MELEFTAYHQSESFNLYNSISGREMVGTERLHSSDQEIPFHWIPDIVSYGWYDLEKQTLGIGSSVVTGTLYLLGVHTMRSGW